MIEARSQGKLLGATFAYESPEKAQLFLAKTKLDIAAKAHLLYGAGLAVKKGERRRGIGKKLLLAREEAGRRRGYNYLLCDSWLESPSPSADLLRSVGMREAARVAAYWRKEKAIKGYCPLCGDICSCTAILFYKPLL